MHFLSKFARIAPLVFIILISVMQLYPWQTTLYKQLTQAFLQQRGHHALLFKTELGLGTEIFIQYFAHFLLCQNNSLSHPCGSCKSCALFTANNHPDFHVVQPIDDKEIGIDQIRAITERLQQFSQQGGNSVVYITDANRLTEAAANALLKTLEEPNANVYFLLQTSLQTSMLATIQSRCQMWLLHIPTHLQALTWLETRFPQTSLDDLSTALRLSSGRPLICKELLENNRLQMRKTFLQTFWKFYKTRDVMLMFDTFEEEKTQVLMQLGWLESFFCDAIKAKLNIAVGWMNIDLQNGILLFSQELNVQQLLYGRQILQQSVYELNEINAVNQELILLDVLTKLVLTTFENNDEPR